MQQSASSSQQNVGTLVKTINAPTGTQNVTIPVSGLNMAQVRKKYHFCP